MLSLDIDYIRQNLSVCMSVRPKLTHPSIHPSDIFFQVYGLVSISDFFALFNLMFTFESNNGIRVSIRSFIIVYLTLHCPFVKG